MKRTWQLFAQWVTVLVAVWFVVSTLKPEWLGGRFGGGVRVFEAPAGAPGAVMPGSLSPAARKASPAVVSITTRQAAVHQPQRNDPWFRFFNGDPEDDEPETGLGSGVIVSPDGYILTNNHVVEGADEIEVTLSDSRRARAKVIGTDPDTDLAILRIELDRLPVIVWGNSDAVQVGDRVLAIGNPFGVGQTVTSGIISALGRNQLGINTAIYSRSGGNMGIGFAIPVSTARQVLEGIVKDGQVVRGWLGVEPLQITPELAETFGLQQTEGVIVTGVLQGGPAAKAGLKPGDVIARVAGQEVGNVSELLTRIAALPPGQGARVDIVRRNQAMSLEVVPAQRPKVKPQR